MKPELECAECSVRVFMRVVENTGASDRTRMIAMTRAIRILAQEMERGTAPVDFSNKIFSMLCSTTKTADPFAEIKRASNEVALSLLPKAWRAVQSKRGISKLRTAALISAAGNELDISTGSYNFSLEGLWQRVLDTVDTGFGVDHSHLLSDDLPKTSSVLMIGDNAGEIVLDVPLIRVIKEKGVKVHYVVRGGPIANDATLEDAAEIGLRNEVDSIVTTGRKAFGIALDDSPKDTTRLLSESSMIISKGQSNYESLNWSPTKTPVYFLFKVKCRPIGATISMP
ncbi:MAG TPA: ARMT1-like domain-containing protein, partial [Thermoproteota archaeon]|nr:ARMT1-like domain-containing protein [Thermoproteota archaeon]